MRLVCALSVSVSVSVSVLVLVLVLASVSVPVIGATASDAGRVSAQSTQVSALHLLRNLKTHAESNRGYDRDNFRDWYDRDGDGCDSRAEVLIAVSLKKVRKGIWLLRADGQMVLQV